MLDCEAASRLLIPAFRVSVARKLVFDYGISQSRAATLLGVKQASISKYLKAKAGKSDNVSRMASYISTNGLDHGILEMALKGSEKESILRALEMASSDPLLTGRLLSSKGVQI